MDCLEGMKKMEDNSVDCIITDPPYSGLNSKSRGKGRFSQDKHHIAFDDMSERSFLLFIKPIFKELYRISKLGGHLYCFTDWKQLRNMMDILELSSWKLVNLICWDKGNFGTGTGYRSQAEYILVFSKGLPNKFNIRNVGNVIKSKRQNKLHPHQKPDELINIFVKNSTKEGDFILDPFMGSGTTAVACKQLGRNFIGFELSKEYVEVANNRLEQTNLTSDYV
jgi:DNA modification methylase|tara:strand:+ start:71 stop:739 length:669 start_codon:yes stop_codon:yes gene_type:complete